MLKSSIPPEIFGVLNPVLIIVMVPLLSALYLRLGRRGINISTTARMSIGFALMTISYAISGVLQHFVLQGFQPGVSVKDGKCTDPNICVSTLWLIPQWFLLSLGEAFMSPEGLKLTYMNVGPMMKSQSLSFWLLMSGLGSFFTLFVGLATQKNPLFTDLLSEQALASKDRGISTPWRFLLFGAMCLAGNIYFVLWSKYVFKTKEQEDEAVLLGEKSMD